MLPLPRARARDHGSVRGAPAAPARRVASERHVATRNRSPRCGGIPRRRDTETRAGSSPHEGAKPWLWQCEQILGEEARYRCYVRLLLLDVDRSRDPARELPRIDRRARIAGTSLAGNCHVLMHEVGRRYAAEHRLTLATLQHAVPRSNDPTCSAGFGMGLIMQLGPEIIRSGGREAARTCLRLPTRYRAYTCVHGLGHALMRGYHGRLRQAVAACRRLGPREAPDCAQGAFHDYWISLRGADGTTRPLRPDTSPRSVCNGHLWYVRPCWYRYFVEQTTTTIDSPADVVRVCRGLRRLQRSGCVGGAALQLGGDPLAQARLCGRFTRARRRKLSARRTGAGPGAGASAPAEAHPRLRVPSSGRAPGLLRLVRANPRRRYGPQVRLRQTRRLGPSRMPRRSAPDGRSARHLLLTGR